MAITGNRVAVPTSTGPAPLGGLLTVHPPKPMPARGEGGVQMEVDDCGHPEAAPGWCLSALAVDGPKHFEAPGTVEGDPFAIYKGVECGLRRQADYAPMARRGLELGGWFAVERGVQTLILNTPDTVVLNGGTAVTPKRAVALLEQHAAERYAGVPTFHASKFGTGFLDLNTDKPVLTTKQFSPIANSGGHTKTGPGGVVAAADQFWLYASGQVDIWWGDITEASAPAPRANVATALAERVVVATAQCFVAAVLVTTTGM
jgi:hypothetical protein